MNIEINKKPNWTIDDVTEAMALNWCWSELDKDAIEASLSANIEAQKNPTQASGVPW